MNEPRLAIDRRRESHRRAAAAACLTARAALASPAWGQRGNPEVRHEGKSVDEMVAELMRDAGVPGVALAIVQAPDVTRAGGYGVADPATGRLVSPNTLFRVDGLGRAAWAQRPSSASATASALDAPPRVRLSITLHTQ